MFFKWVRVMEIFTNIASVPKLQNSKKAEPVVVLISIDVSSRRLTGVGGGYSGECLIEKSPKISMIISFSFWSTALGRVLYLTKWMKSKRKYKNYHEVVKQWRKAMRNQSKRDFLLWNVWLIVSDYQVNVVVDVKRAIGRFKSYCDLKSTKALHLSGLK